MRFTLAEVSGVRIRVDGTPSHFDPLVYLRSGSCEGGAELACQDVKFLYTENLELAALPPGGYHLFVKSFAPEATGDFQVTLETMPGGFCLDDPFEENDTGVAATDLNQAAQEPLLLCPADADWFRLPLFAGDELRLTVTLADEADPTLLQLEVSSPEGSPLPLVRTDEAGTVRATVATVPSTGSYLLRLGLNEDAPLPFLAYRLDFEVFTVHGTIDCTNPSTLTSGGEVLGNTGVAANHSEATCTSPLVHTAPEVVYKFHLDQEASVSVELEADWPYALYLRRRCSSALFDNEVACRALDRIWLPALAAGTYHVFVDGYRDAAGPYLLRFEAGPPRNPPANDRCDAALELQLGETVEGSTFLGMDDFRASCTAPLGHTAPDVVYRFTLAEPRRIRLELTPVNDQGEPWVAALYLRQQECGNTLRELQCDNLGPRLEADLQPDEYYVIVDGWRSDAGPFRLSLTAL